MPGPKPAGLASPESAGMVRSVEREPADSKEIAPAHLAVSSNHKPRAAWFRARAAWPLREPPVSTLIRERARVRRQLPAPAYATSWQLAGPTNIGGRCTSLVVHPTDADRLWIGAAGGGVWASTDAGRTWKASWKDRAPLEIGSLALDPTNPAVLYAGTGEANLSADSYAGDGVYRSANSGRTWSRWAASASTGLPRRIGVIAVDPFDSRHVLVGGIGFGRNAQEADLGGLHETRDGGTTWKRLGFVSADNYWCHSIVFHPVARGTALVSVTGPGAHSGLWGTVDGQTWTQRTSGLPSPEKIGRTSLALAPSNPDIMWAISAPDDGDAVLGVFQSTDRGMTWVNRAGSHFSSEGQMQYGNAIAVHPTDSNTVICGGVDLHLTKNGGTTWRRASQWDADRGTSNYAHADHHVLVMPTAAPGRLYSANDGGCDVSEDVAAHWQNRSAGLSATMFYDIDCAQTQAGPYGGGAQDNGTLVTDAGDPAAFYEILGGDGGWIVIDPREAGHIYASYQFGGMYRFRNNQYKDVTPPAFKDTSRPENARIWMVYITIDPNNSNTVYTGNQRLYRTKNDGVSWAALTPVLDGSPVSAIEVAPADSLTLYVATENGSFFRSTDGGATWSGNLASSELGGVMITRVETNPTDARSVYITVANFGGPHVFRSTDGGTTWNDIDNGKLPDAPYHALLMRPDAAHELIVCSDAGVFSTSDDGGTWRNLTGNLPNVMVVDIVYQTSTKQLFAATYGRSIWRLTLP